MVGGFAPHLAVKIGTRSGVLAPSQSQGGGPLTTRYFMLITMELTHGRSRNKLVHILVPSQVSGSGAKHGNYESNALLAGLESAPGPAGLAAPIWSFSVLRPL